MKTPPKELFIELTQNAEISQAAAVEAAMSHLKIKSGDAGAKYVYLYLDFIRSREDVFLFAMEFGKFLADFESGRKAVPAPVKEMFYASLHSKN